MRKEHTQRRTHGRGDGEKCVEKYENCTHVYTPNWQARRQQQQQRRRPNITENKSNTRCTSIQFAFSCMRPLAVRSMPVPMAAVWFVCFPLFRMAGIDTKAIPSDFCICSLSLSLPPGSRTDACMQFGPTVPQLVLKPGASPHRMTFIDHFFFCRSHFHSIFPKCTKRLESDGKRFLFGVVSCALARLRLKQWIETTFSLR